MINFDILLRLFYFFVIYSGINSFIQYVFCIYFVIVYNCFAIIRNTEWMCFAVSEQKLKRVKSAKKIGKYVIKLTDFFSLHKQFIQLFIWFSRR